MVAIFSRPQCVNEILPVLSLNQWLLDNFKPTKATHTSFTQPNYRAFIVRIRQKNDHVAGLVVQYGISNMIMLDIP